MASEIAEYSLSWVDHASDFFLNLKDIFQRKECVDVTLVADGHMLSAHRLVLSALSPYFRQIFAQVPANQSAFVFLKDVSKKTLEDLITFIYSGKVDVKHENLEEILHTAKALKINGLCDQSYAHSSQSQPQSFNSSTPTYEGVQYQSTRTIHVPVVSAKPDQDQSNYYRQPTNAFDQRLSNVENEDTNGHDDDYNSIRYDYDYDDYCGSDMAYDNPMAMDQEYAMQNDQWNVASTDGAEVKPAKPNGLKPVKRLEYGATEYNILADIRSNGIGSENLFYNNHKFNKHNKPNKYGQQRWQCTTRVGGQRCRGAASTMEINRAVMMKILIAEHSH